MGERFGYSEEEARNEADAMSDLVGEQGKTEDYDAAAELLAEIEAASPKKIEEKEFDITPDVTDQKSEEKEWDITPAGSENQSPAQEKESDPFPPQPEWHDAAMKDLPSEGGKNAKYEPYQFPEEKVVDPLSAQPVWYDKVREGLPSDGGRNAEYKPYQFSEGKNGDQSAEEESKDPLSAQPIWYDKVREGLPSDGGRNAEYKPYQFKESADESSQEKEDMGIDGLGRIPGRIFISENYLKSEHDIPKEIQDEAENAVAEMPEEDRMSLLKGFAELGYRVQGFKGETLAKAFSWAAEKFEEKSFGNRLFESYGDIYKEIAERADADLEKFRAEGSVVSAAKSVGMLAGNMLMYGRAVAGFGTPLGSVTGAAMALGRGGEAVKEAHLRSEEVIEEGRVHDIEEAQEQARKIYEEAKERSEGGVVTKEQLMQAYAERLPQDLIDRLGNYAGTEGFIAQCAQRAARWDIGRSAEKAKEKIEAIKKSALSKEQKKKMVAQFTKKYEKFLEDMDRMVANGGSVDMIAYTSRLMEKGGKAGATFMALETLGELAVAGVEAFEGLAEQEEQGGISAEGSLTALPDEIGEEVFSDEETETIVSESTERIEKKFIAPLGGMEEGENELPVKEEGIKTEEIPPDMTEQLTDTRNRAVVAETLEKAYTPEEIEKAQIPGEKEWPPTDEKTPEQRIAETPWDSKIGEKKFIIHEDALDDVEPKIQQEIPKDDVITPEVRAQEVEFKKDAGVPQLFEKTGHHEYSYKGPEGVFTGKFLYNENNEVIGVQPQGTLGMKGIEMTEKSMLNDNWMEKTSESGNPYLARQEIKMAAHDLGIKKRILEVMEKAGEKDTKEYQFLRKAIDRRIGRLEEKFGDIFK